MARFRAVSRGRDLKLRAAWHLDWFNPAQDRQWSRIPKPNPEIRNKPEREKGKRAWGVIAPARLRRKLAVVRSVVALGIYIIAEERQVTAILLRPQIAYRIGYR